MHSRIERLFFREGLGLFFKLINSRRRSHVGATCNLHRPRHHQPNHQRHQRQHHQTERTPHVNVRHRERLECLIEPELPFTHGAFEAREQQASEFCLSISDHRRLISANQPLANDEPGDQHCRHRQRRTNPERAAIDEQPIRNQQHHGHPHRPGQRVDQYFKVQLRTNPRHTREHRLSSSLFAGGHGSFPSRKV